MKIPELLSPAGSFAALKAAIDAGADSIYFGLDELNMRTLAGHNFNLENLPKCIALCKKHNIKSYLTLNSLIYDRDIALFKKSADAAKSCGVDAIIASDMAVLEYLKKIKISAHVSTQANVGNLEAVRFFAGYADTIVLARELTLQQITDIIQGIEKEKIKGPSGNLVKIEIFIHGALCIAISGRCYMSLALYNKSANRGQCLQPCRRKYKIIDENTQKELVIDNKYVMSPKDLCTIGLLDKIVKSGVSILKIEGRARSADYVWQVTKTYKEALICLLRNKYSLEKIKKLKSDLEKVYNRGFWEGGYYLGQETKQWSNVSGSKASQKKTYLGKAVKYFSNLKVAEFLLEAGSLKIGQEVYITGPTTGLLKMKVLSLHTNGPVLSAQKGEKAAILVGKKVRRNDQLYLIEKTTQSS